MKVEILEAINLGTYFIRLDKIKIKIKVNKSFLVWRIHPLMTPFYSQTHNLIDFTRPKMNEVFSSSENLVKLKPIQIQVQVMNLICVAGAKSQISKLLVLISS